MATIIAMETSDKTSNCIISVKQGTWLHDKTILVKEKASKLLDKLGRDDSCQKENFPRDNKSSITGPCQAA